MTLYVVELVVPANTPDISPVAQRFTVEKGVITKVQVHFPPGVAGKVYTAAFIGHYQLFPRPFGTWLTGDGETITFEPFYEIETPRATLTIYGKSPGALYSHRIIWRIQVLPKAVALPHLVISRIVEALSSFIEMLTRGRR
jgi:hypothetical protein